MIICASLKHEMNNLMNQYRNQFKSYLQNIYSDTLHDTKISEDDNEDNSDTADDDEDDGINAEKASPDDNTLDTLSITQCDPEKLEQFNYKETTSDITSSLAFLSRRITRNYASEFILPDDTRIAVSRLEGIYPMDNNEQVILSLSVGHKYIYIGQQSTNIDQPSPTTTQTNPTNSFNKQVSLNSSEKLNGSNHQGMINKPSLNHTIEETNIDESLSDMDSAHHDLNESETSISYITRGLQIIDYLEDDLWAATILQCDNSSNAGLLRQLEAGCRLQPEAYKMERVQTVKSRETVIDFPSKPTVRTIGLSRSTSDTDSIDTTLTGVDFDGET
uniref:Ras-associating domain-containing protein n=1 Tax=Schistosoma mansoni TaxID=6183 RepID=A0A3Q0KN34_SCHMA